MLATHFFSGYFHALQEHFYLAKGDAFLLESQSDTAGGVDANWHLRQDACEGAFSTASL